MSDAAKIKVHPSDCECESCEEFERLAAESANARSAASGRTNVAFDEKGCIVSRPEDFSAARRRPQVAPPSDEVRRTFEFADRVYICDYCGSMQPSGDKDCPACGRDLFTWAGFLGRSDRFRVGSGDLPERFDQ